MRKACTLIAIMFVLLCIQTYAQDRTITGKVTSSKDNLGIPGVSVVVEGTTIGTNTDIDGNYSLTVPPDAKKIMISAVGMKSKTIDLAASNTVDVTLDDDVLKLDEVVVTALGIPKDKKSLGYSVQQVSGDDLNKAEQGNVVNSLSGKVAGVQVITGSGSPGASSNIRIRGANSVTLNNEPLFVIDGIPIDNSQNSTGNPDDGRNNYLGNVGNSNRAIDINPDDIESISVLKGASATALYGIGAGNGAIIITTKKGAKSATGQPINVTFNTSYSFESNNRNVETQQKYGQGSRFDANDVYTNSPIYYGPETGSFYKRFSWGPDVSTLSYDGDQSYAWSADGKIVPNTDPTAVSPAKLYDQNDFWETGYTVNNSISLSGGTDLSTFRVSLSNLTQHGTIPLSEFSRTTISLAGATAISRKIRVSGSMNYSKSGGRRIQQGSNTSGLMLGLLRTPNSFDNSNGTDDPEDPTAYVFPTGRPRTYRGTGGYDNPYWTINRNPFEDDVERLIGNVQADYNVLDWLMLTYRIGGDIYSDTRLQGIDIYSATAPAGRVINDNYVFRQVNSHLRLSAQKKLTDKINGSFTVGHEIKNMHQEELYVQGDALNIPTLFNMSNANSVNSQNPIENYRTYSLFFDVKFDYNYFLYLEFTGRNDWSSTLPEESRSFFYPAVSAGFVFTEAFGLTDNSVLPYGKLRASYAMVGKDAPLYSTSNYFGKTAITDGWTSGISFPFEGTGGFTTDDGLGNTKLEPEKQTEFEIGTDLRFLNNRIGLDFTYYNRLNKNVIFPVSIAGTSGYLSAVFNSGEISNNGIEITLNLTPVMTKDFKWDLTFNWSKNTSKVKALAPGLEQIILNGFEGTGVYAIKDQPYGVIYGYDYMHDASGNVVLDDNGSPVVGATDYNPLYGTPIAATAPEVIGDPNPDWLGGIANTFTWKGFSLYALIDIKSGGDIWNGTKGALSYFGTSKITESRGEMKTFEGVMGHIDADGNIAHYDGTGGEVVGSGAQNTTPAELGEYWYTTEGGGFGTTSKQFIEDGSYIKLREVAISYDFTRVLLKNKKFIKGLEFGIFARNIILNTDYDGVDPETSLIGSGNAQGMDYFNMPNVKSIGANLKVNF